jgi:hypothetical protein
MIENLNKVLTRVCARARSSRARSWSRTALAAFLRGSSCEDFTGSRASKVHELVVRMRKAPGGAHATTGALP